MKEIILLNKVPFLTGFGNTDDLTLEPTGPSYLQHAEIKFIPDETCTDIWGKKNPTFDLFGVKFEEIDSVLCAGDPGKGICQGDSGGPLYDEENNAIVGITSFSSLQCSELPSGFSNVSNVVCSGLIVPIFLQMDIFPILFTTRCYQFSGRGFKRQYVVIRGSIIPLTSAKHTLGKNAVKVKP